MELNSEDDIKIIRKKNDFLGGYLPWIYYEQNGKRYYRKQVRHYLKKFLLDYAKAISTELDVPMIDYKFASDGKTHYLISEDYDDKLPDYRVVEKNFDADNIFSVLDGVKSVCSKYSNGDAIYEKFLRQILFSYVICDWDRNEHNCKLYEKNNHLEICPYLDIDGMFMWDEDLEVYWDEYYYFPDDMQKHVDWLNSGPRYDDFVHSVEQENEDFKFYFDKYYNYMFRENIFCSKDDEHNWKVLFKRIYDEIKDKSIFDKMANLDFETIEKKYNLVMSDNARTVISTMFDIQKERFNEYYDEILNDNKKIK